MTPCDLMAWHQMTSHGMTENVTPWRHTVTPCQTPSHTLKIMFFDLVTLTIALIRYIIKINSYAKFWVCRFNSSGTRGLTDEQTNFIPSTADTVGGIPWEVNQKLRQLGPSPVLTWNLNSPPPNLLGSLILSKLRTDREFHSFIFSSHLQIKDQYYL